MTYERVPQMITEFLTNVSTNPLVVLLFINLILLAVGLFLDTVPAIIVIAERFDLEDTDFLRKPI